jgi:guanylate kinase
LISRSTDNAETIKKRVAKAVEEISYADKFDLVIINDVLAEAQEKAYTAVKNFISDIDMKS